MKFRIDYKHVLPFIEEKEILDLAKRSKQHLQSLLNKTGKGNEFLGWLSLPGDIVSQLEKIEQLAVKLRSQAKATVVVGIGGSYLGAKSVIEALGGWINSSSEDNDHKVIFAGQNLSEEYMAGLMSFLEGVDFNIIVISKSGTTTEPAIAFRILKKMLEERLGKEKASKRIVAITDAHRGALKQLSEKEGYATFIIPDNVGGRYSVLTPVGLLPIACAGYNIKLFIKGAQEMANNTLGDESSSNPVLLYASIRNLLYRNGKKVELLINYEPGLHYISEWWKQLFGESEGKEGKGIFPSSADFTTDLHSIGQYIQEGERIFFETVVSVSKSKRNLKIPFDEDNLDKLNYISGLRLSEVNHKAEEATIMAHVDGGVPNIRLILPEISEEYLGQLLYFFEVSCAVSGYELGVNPFDQPGVEAYKNNMFSLLGKPGFS